MTDSTAPTASRSAQSGAHPLETLFELVHRAKDAETLSALRFIAVNDSHLIAPFQQSALWLREGGVVALSGLLEVDRNAPFVQWLEKLANALVSVPPKVINHADLPEPVASEWDQWLPEHVIWIPFGNHMGHSDGARGGLIVARPMAWREIDLRLFSEWMSTWICIYRSRETPTLGMITLQALRWIPRAIRERPVIWAAVLLCGSFFPVRISVLAPGELVPANPIVVRAPSDGIIKAFHVETNDKVKEGQLLFSYDDATLSGKLEVALEVLRTAEVEERQFSQQALNDPKARSALSAARGAVEEKKIEVEYLKRYLQRNRVLAPRAGVAFVDDPREWIGRSVVAGQRIMRIADPADKEIEAWLSLADGIELPDRASVRLYLNSSPMAPVTGEVRFVSYDAVRRPEGYYSYRIRATIPEGTPHRVGLKGTVRLSGKRVPLIYWLFRRPLASLRGYFGY